MPKVKHDWNTLENYLSVHQKVWKKYNLALATGLPFYKVQIITDQYWELKAEGFSLTTNSGTLLKVDIRKEIEVDDSQGRKKVARTYGYTYSCNLPSRGPLNRGRNLIRYCSPHDPRPDEPGHHPYHHRHDFTGIYPTIKLIKNMDEVPHVSEFLDEIIGSF